MQHTLLVVSSLCVLKMLWRISLLAGWKKLSDPHGCTLCFRARSNSVIFREFFLVDGVWWRFYSSSRAEDRTIGCVSFPQLLFVESFPFSIGERRCYWKRVSNNVCFGNLVHTAGTDVFQLCWHHLNGQLLSSTWNDALFVLQGWEPDAEATTCPAVSIQDWRQSQVDGPALIKRTPGELEDSLAPWKSPWKKKKVTGTRFDRDLFIWNSKAGIPRGTVLFCLSRKWDDTVGVVQGGEFGIVTRNLGRLIQYVVLSLTYLNSYEYSCQLCCLWQEIESHSRMFWQNTIMDWWKHESQHSFVSLGLSINFYFLLKIWAVCFIPLIAIGYTFPKPLT